MNPQSLVLPPHLGNVKSQNRDLWPLVNPIPPIFKQPHCVPMMWFHPLHPPWFLLVTLLRCLYPWWKPLQPSALHSLHLAGTNLWAQRRRCGGPSHQTSLLVHWVNGWTSKCFFFTGKNLWCSFLVDIWYIYIYVYIIDYNSMYVYMYRHILHDCHEYVQWD